MIFVAIANYRDSECQPTVEALLLKARRPSAITIGVLSQLGPDDPPLRPHPQLRQVIVPHSASRGVCWARHRVYQLWQGEPYTLQIDSHMRFAQGWDEMMLDQLARCRPAPRPLLSTYPMPYYPPADSGDGGITHLAPRAFEDGVLALGSVTLVEPPARPIPGAFVAGGFIFGSSQFHRQCPYDPDHYFLGEEIAYAVRLWTHGWNPHAPNCTLLWHDYTSRERSRHWDDHIDWAQSDAASKRRIKRLLAGEHNGPYGLGTVRSVKDFEHFAKIDFTAQTIA